MNAGGVGGVALTAQDQVVQQRKKIDAPTSRKIGGPVEIQVVDGVARAIVVLAPEIPEMLDQNLAVG